MKEIQSIDRCLWFENTTKKSICLRHSTQLNQILRECLTSIADLNDDMSSQKIQRKTFADWKPQNYTSNVQQMDPNGYMCFMFRVMFIYDPYVQTRPNKSM